MANVDPAFINVLDDMGFDVNTRDYFEDNGIHNLPALVRMMPSALKEWISAERKVTRTALLKVKFQYLPVMVLQSYRAWAIYRKHCGFVDDVRGFTEALSEEWGEHCELILQEKDEEDSRPKLTPLLSLDDWPKWEEQFLTHLRTVRNLKTQFSLEYICRAESVVPLAAREADSNTIDEQVCALALHSGQTFERDKKRLWSILKPLVEEGPAWCFVQPFSKKTSLDGRAAFLAIKMQAEGQSALTTRKANSYNAIRNALWTGKNSGWTLDKYIQVHQKAHNELVTLDEPVPETKKVSDFLAGIQGDALATSKEVIAGDKDKNSSFEACQQYLKSVALVRHTPQSTRGIKRLHQER